MPRPGEHVAGPVLRQIHRQKLAEFEIFQHLGATFMRHLGQEPIGTLIERTMGVLDGMIGHTDAAG